MLTTLAGTLLAGSTLFAQSENVPAYHPVYTFLKRMEVKQVIERYPYSQAAASAKPAARNFRA